MKGRVIFRDVLNFNKCCDEEAEAWVLFQSLVAVFFELVAVHSIFTLHS